MRHIWILALGILAAGNVTAQDQTWTGTTSADWNLGNNWSGGDVPGTIDTAVLGAILNQSITNSVATNIGGIRVDTPGFSVTNNTGFLSTFTFNNSGISGTKPFSIINATSGSSTNFLNNSTAGHATITNSGDFSRTRFTGTNSTAGTATITNSGANSFTEFNGTNSTAGMATITNAGANSSTQFTGTNSSAGTAIITNTNPTSFISFIGSNSTAENAKLIINNGNLLIAGPSTLKVGSLSNTGSNGIVRPQVSNKTISLGQLGLNDTFGGQFIDNSGFVLSLTKEGTGTFVVTNTNHTYSGPTTVNGGTLQWDGGWSLASSAFTINPLGTLTGVNDIPGVGLIGNLTNNGLVAPGNPSNAFGALVVISYSSPTKGTLRFNISPTQNSKIATSIGATLTNTTCDLVFTAGRYKNTSHTLISQNGFGPLTGTFSAITGTPVRLTTFVTYLTVAPKNAILHTNERPFIDVLSTFFNNGNADQRSLAGALDSAAANPNLSSDFNNVISQFNVLPQGDFLFAMDSIGSDHYNQQTLADFYGTEMITGLVAPSGAWSPAGGMNFTSKQDYAPHARKSGATFEQATLALKHKHGTAMRDSVRNLLSHNPGKGHIWLQGFSGKASSETTRQDLGFYANSAGVMMGLDYAVCSDLRMGVAGGYSHTNMDVNRALGHSSNESPFGSIWANYQRGLMDYDFGFTAKRNSVDNKRNINVLGLQRTATAHYHGHDLVPHVGVARHYWLHDEKLHIKPFASVDLFYNHADGFTETGANSLNLKVKERNSSLLQSSIGMAFDRHIHWCTGTIKPEIAVKYMNRAVLRRPRTQANFVDQNAFFVSTGDDDMKHRLGLNAGFSYVWKNGGTFKLGYQGDYGKGQKSHMGLISLGKSW